MSKDQIYSECIRQIFDFLPYKAQETIDGPIPLFSREISNICIDHFYQHIDFEEKNKRLDERLSEVKKNYPNELEFLEWAEAKVDLLKQLNLDVEIPEGAVL